MRNGLFRNGRCAVADGKNRRNGAERAFLWRETVSPDVRKRTFRGAEKPFLRCGRAFFADLKCDARTTERRKRLCHRDVRDVRENGVFAAWDAVAWKKASNVEYALDVYSLSGDARCIFMHVFPVSCDVVVLYAPVCLIVAYGMRMAPRLWVWHLRA